MLVLQATWLPCSPAPLLPEEQDRYTTVITSRPWKVLYMAATLNR